jgi:prepilin-type N-terminal cleavage/methylation domain-containing protein
MVTARRGVTLVELVVVLGLVATLAVAGYAQQLAGAGARAKASAEGVASLMQRVTLLAFSQNRPYRILFTVGSGALTVQYLSSSNAWVDGTSQTAPSWLQTQPVITGGTIVASTTFANNRWVASPIGSLDVNGATVGGVSTSTTAGTVVLQTTAGGATLKVISTAAGRITISR